MNVIDNFLDQINRMPMLPKVVQEVAAQLDNEDVDLKALAASINHDQVLAARVLRMSNSAYFGCSRSIKTVEDAVALIGLENVATLVVASGVTTTFTNVPGLNLQHFWVHSLVTASIARQISRDAGLDAATAYIAGLLHSVGQLPIHLVFPAAGAQVTEMCRGRSVLERKAAEQSILGIDHCQIGEMLAKMWNFPEEILCVLRHYVEPFKAGASEFAPVVYAAVYIASEFEREKTAAEIAASLDAEVMQALNWNDADALIERIEHYRIFVQEAQSYL
jgi:HD-like signal output (HDOD) protein